MSSRSSKRGQKGCITARVGHVVLHGLSTVEAMNLAECKGGMKSTGGPQRQQGLVESSDLIEPDTELVAFTSWYEDLDGEARESLPKPLQNAARNLV